MSAGTLKKPVVALVVVVVLGGGLMFAARNIGAHRPEGAIVGIFDGLSPASVSAVRMAQNGDTIALVRRDRGWTVNGWDADSSAVAGLFATLREARIGDIAASNPADHARLGVADSSASKITFETEGPARTLLVGGAGPRYGTTYVRLAGDDTVYLAEAGDLRARMDRSSVDWRNKRVAHVDTAAVTRVEIARGHEGSSLVRGDSAWSVAGDGKAADPAVKDMLSGLADLRADAFLTAADSIAALPEAVTVTALGVSGDTLAALHFGDGTTDRWARVRGDSVLYRVRGALVDQVAPTKSTLVGGG